MSAAPSGTPRDPCILDDVQPFLSELREPVGLQVCGERHSGRPRAARFVRRVFRHSFGADLEQLYPTLLSFADPRRLRAVVGYRDGRTVPLFAEHYLSRPAEQLIGDSVQQTVEREALVEVGNLALTDAGDARWVIAAVTCYLHELGYRWVLFTAIRPLVNAFRRLGMNPLALATADRHRLDDDGRHWGCYYENRPVVCAGSISSGLRKLQAHRQSMPSSLRALLDDAALAAREGGIRTACGGTP